MTGKLLLFGLGAIAVIGAVSLLLSKQDDNDQVTRKSTFEPAKKEKSHESNSSPKVDLNKKAEEVEKVKEDVVSSIKNRHAETETFLSDSLKTIFENSSTIQKEKADSIVVDENMIIITSNTEETVEDTKEKETAEQSNKDSKLFDNMNDVLDTLLG